MQSPFDTSSSSAIGRFISFLQIPSVSAQGPSGPYQQAVDFLANQFSLLNLPTRIISLVPGKPILIATWPGSDPSLPSILLNSHYDVVPAVPECWKTPPFAAHVDEKGDIYARGTQDMKSVCMQYVEAVARLRLSGTSFARTIHLTFVPDEEVGGEDGMDKFVMTSDFQELKVGLALDEGLASPSNAFTVFYGERVPWWVMVNATGNVGHGSRFIANTAMEKLINFVNKALAFRKEQEKKLHGGCDHGVAKKLGDVITLNLTVLKGYVDGPTGGGFAFNVIPSKAQAGFDIRIPPSVNLEEFEKMLQAWAAEDEGVTIDFANSNRLREHHVTTPDKATNPWWKVFSENLEAQGFDIEPEVFPAATDSRFLRKVGLPCLGFSPINNTPILLHDHNEYISSDVYLNGINIYANLIPALANASGF